MLVEFAQADPEAVRELFRMLYNEELPLAQRYTAFREGFENYIKQRRKQETDQNRTLQHFQDLRAVMVYLTCEYPETYYLFKSRVFAAFGGLEGGKLYPDVPADPGGNSKGSGAYGNELLPFRR